MRVHLWNKSLTSQIQTCEFAQHFSKFTTKIKPAKNYHFYSNGLVKVMK